MPLRYHFKPRRPLVIGLIAFAFVWLIAYPDREAAWSYTWPQRLSPSAFLSGGPKRMPATAPLPPLGDRVACLGPRDEYLNISKDDALHPASIPHSYPVPFIGSHEALNLERTWMTANARWGPYGFRETESSYNRSRVAWDKIDWGKLQNACFDRNAHRFPTDAMRFDSAVRFGFLNQTTKPATRSWQEFNSTRRTAILVRAWDGYEYKDEDMHYLRSVIVETALRTGGEYQVVLLVNIKDPSRNIFSSKEAYNKAFKEAGIPKELQSIAVLWDDNLLESWYPSIEEHQTMWQVYQPVQLFALHYPEFDHYWQIELDMRFTGDAGKFLDALSDFSRKEPRKQAFERATFQHMQSEIGDYANFSKTVDLANHGGAHYWGHVPNPDLAPIGPVPPTPRATDEGAWDWGVGEDADVLVTSYCMNATNNKIWMFKDWIGGFSAGGAQAPRYFCPPAIQRGSRALLLAIHEVQVTRSMYLPSEATLPTFALWLGLKLSYAPHPVYFKRKDDKENTLGWWKGGPLASPSGLGPEDLAHPRGEGMTWWWESKWPRLMMDSWTDGTPPVGDPDFPWLLASMGDQIFAPNMIIHPMKHR